MTINRRDVSRRAMQEFIDRSHTRGYFPTTREVTRIGLDAYGFSFTRLFQLAEQMMERVALGILESKDPATKLRRYLLQLSSDGQRRWHPHGQMSFEGLDNSGRFVTRPQADAQARAERIRELEREVVRAMESELGRAVTTAEAWPRVEKALEDAGLR